MKNSNLRKGIEDYFEGVPRKAEASDKCFHTSADKPSRSRN